jgi:phage replication O-like protein O
VFVADVQLENGFTRIANDLIEALSRTNLSSQEFRVFMAIARKTYGWGKTEDKLSVSQLSDMTKISRSHISKVIKRLTNRNMILRNGVTGIQKNFDKWVSPKQGIPQMGVSPKQGKGVSPNHVTLLSPNQGDTKETYKETYKETLPQVKFVESFAKYYHALTGQKFSASKKHYIIAASLIKQNGYEACVYKAKCLAEMCQEGTVWFCKEGMIDFTIEKLSSQWNAIIKVEKMDESFIKNVKMLNKLRKDRGQDELPPSAYTRTGACKPSGETLRITGSTIAGQKEGVSSSGTSKDEILMDGDGEGDYLDDDSGCKDFEAVLSNG